MDMEELEYFLFMADAEGKSQEENNMISWEDEADQNEIENDRE